MKKTWILLHDIQFGQILLVQAKRSAADAGKSAYDLVKKLYRGDWKSFRKKIAEKYFHKRCKRLCLCATRYNQTNKNHSG